MSRAVVSGARVLPSKPRSHNAYQELATILIVTDEIICARTEELEGIKMRPGQDPTTYYQNAGVLRDEPKSMGELVTERRFKITLI